jgi:hypothetical protein
MRSERSGEQRIRVLDAGRTGGTRGASNRHARNREQLVNRPVRGANLLHAICVRLFVNANPGGESHRGSSFGAEVVGSCAIPETQRELSARLVSALGVDGLATLGAEVARNSLTLSLSSREWLTVWTSHHRVIENASEVSDGSYRSRS